MRQQNVLKRSAVECRPLRTQRMISSPSAQISTTNVHYRHAILLWRIMTNMVQITRMRVYYQVCWFAVVCFLGTLQLEEKWETAMGCLQCQGIESFFNKKLARKEMRIYRRKGPNRATSILIEALTARGIEKMTLLDIGGGVGAVHHALLRAGIAKATDIDASTSYIEAARRESEHQGHAGQVRYRHGDFVNVAPEIETADVTTLDRVICCYGDMHSLVAQSADLTRKYYGAVYPRDTGPVKFGMAIGNLFMRLARRPFRVFAHPTRAVDSLLRRHGMQRCFRQKSGPVWQVVVYERRATARYQDDLRTRAANG